MIQSQTITGNRNHPRGKVIASIVKVTYDFLIIIAIYHY